MGIMNYILYVFLITTHLALGENLNEIKQNVRITLISDIHNDTCAFDNTRTFSIIDYVVIILFCAITLIIGLYYGLCDTSTDTSDDFLLGGSDMPTWAMAISLATSFVTAIELLGNPAEMYFYGAQFWLICSAIVIILPITIKFYLPIFMKLRFTSSFEYFELRFSSNTRFFVGFLYIVQMIFYNSVAVYAPAVVVTKFTGINVYVAVIMIYFVCILYSSQGGMKSVIMTDAFQTLVLFASLILILVFGILKLSNAKLFWNESFETGRLQFFNIDPSLTIRHSFWSVLIGGSFYWAYMFCTNQASIQKYLSVRHESQVHKALYFSCISLVVIYSINFFTGMAIVAYYKNCDPFASGSISNTDEILPYFVINDLGDVSGLVGLFSAGIFAASLGTVAAALTSISAVVCEDFISKYNQNFIEKKGALVAKVASVISGIVSFFLVFVIAQLGSILQLTLSFNGVLGGVILGLFSLGMFFPWANSKGALIGGISSFVVMLWIAIGSQIIIANGYNSEQKINTSISECRCLPNSTYENFYIEVNNDDTDIFILYKISYLWYTAIGCMTTVIIGVFVSLVTNKNNFIIVSNDLISPPVIQFLNFLPLKLKNVLKIDKVLENQEQKQKSNEKQQCA